ncbi:MAG: phytoene/squalene synthase family protein [Crocinitomicaceae bacterium]|nr:phytoene/squalene synthase family protein [Crocinitomicaceae bacterium]
MKKIFDEVSVKSSREVTRLYSTSFYAGVQRLDKSIRDDVHAIYGFVRFADEIVDTFHDFDKAQLLSEFTKDTYAAIERKISLNPILNSFQHTVHKYQIDHDLIDQFLHSMEMDLAPVDYNPEKYKEYILGSAEVVGLMCLKVFVYGNEAEYQKLKPYAMTLGSAFQKINFLRDLKDDVQNLGRVYFPNIEDINNLSLEEKLEIENEIEKEFRYAYEGIQMLPKSSRFGVYLSYVYYSRLLKEIKNKTIQELMNNRISVSSNTKWYLFFKCYLRNSINLI